MGLFKMLKNYNNEEGTREAIRVAYKQHRRHGSFKGLLPEGASPHHAALSRALLDRYKARGIKVTEAVQAVAVAELTPFRFLEEEEAVEALAEYAAYQEYPSRISAQSKRWLQAKIKEGVNLYEGTESEADLEWAVDIGKRYELKWLELL